MPAARRLCDPETVFRLDGGLAGDVLASESSVWRQPRGCVFIAFGTVGGAVSSHEIERVVSKFLALVGVELLGALLPRIAEGNDVVDLDIRAGVLATRQGNRGAGVLIGEGSCHDHTVVGAWLESFVRHVAGEDVVAAVAAVAINVSPSRSKFGASVASL